MTMTKKKSKNKPAASNAPASELVPTGQEFQNRNFVNSPEFQNLQAEVERRKEKGIAGRPIMQFKRGFVHVGEEVTRQLDALRERHGITEEQMESAERQIVEDREREVAELTRQKREARWRAMCPPLFREPFNFDLVEPGVKRESVDAVLNWRFGSRGLFVLGDTGLSKTRAMFAMLRREAIEADRVAVVMDGVEFANQCSVAFKDSSLTERWLRALAKPDIVAIDDLAKRFTKATQEGFFAMLDRRTAQMKPVIVTTNCSGDKLDEMINDPDLSGPLRRRLRQYCEVVLF